MTTPKKPRPITADRICPTRDCYARMNITHTWPTESGVSKHRHCPKCGRTDLVNLKIEVTKIVDLTESDLRPRKSRKKVSSRLASTQVTPDLRAGSKQQNTHNEDGDKNNA